MSSFDKGKILVTGGAGFIGSALIWALNERGYEHIIVSDFLGEDDKFKNLVPLKYENYLEGDTLMEAIQLQEPFLSDIKWVFHLGACSATTEKDCRYLVQNNYEYTKLLADWALTQGARFVYASSAATYGDGAQGMNDKDLNIERLRPLNMYGYSKHMFDLYAKRQGWLDKTVGLKYFNVFGPNEHHKGDMRSVVHKAFGQIQESGKVNLFKSYHPDYRNGEQMRDFLYVKDAVSMTLHLAENNKANGLFNLGSGKANTWLTLVTAIFSALDKKPKIDFIDMPEHLKAKYQYFTEADTSKIKETSYSQEVTPLDEAVRDYVQNYLVPARYLGD